MPARPLRAGYRSDHRSGRAQRGDPGRRLVKAGIPEASALLVKPDSATDGTVSKEAARRVEVTVQ